jgi:hypothetical protein
MTRSSRIILVAGLVASTVVAAVAVPALTTSPTATSPTVMPATAVGKTIYACLTARHTLSRVSVTKPPTCPAGTVPVQWEGLAGQPVPSPSASPTTTSAAPSPSPTTPTTPTTTPPTNACVTSARMGQCGPYPPAVAGTTSDRYVDQNVWSPITGWKQTLTAYGPGNWRVDANMPAGNTAVVSFPNTGQPMNETPLARFSQLTASYAETMNKTASTSGWAMFDIWINDWDYEVMIQHDFARNGDCKTVASVTFRGQSWHLCDFGHVLAWKLGADEAHKASEQTGTVDLLAMLTWLESHGYLPQNPHLTNISYGWEICSTGGADETFRVTYELTGVLA